MKCDEAVILASGPSLTAEDCEQVRQWRTRKPGRVVLVINTTFRMAPWADAVVAMDRKWWTHYSEEVFKTFPGERYSTLDIRGVERLAISGAGNSGGVAIIHAVKSGAGRIILLGFDGKPGEKVHWHGDHPAGLGNAISWKSWPGKMARVMHRCRGVKVINCSRSTIYTLWPRMPLEDALQ